MDEVFSVLLLEADGLKIVGIPTNHQTAIPHRALKHSGEPIEMHGGVAQKQASRVPSALEHDGYCT